MHVFQVLYRPGSRFISREMGSQKTVEGVGVLLQIKKKIT